MNELESILIAHAGRYPAMQPTDAVKLLYQNEFGGGHLIRDGAAALHYLRREYEAVEKDPAAPLAEDIGSGLVRIHLAALPAECLEQLGRDFITSAARHTGALPGFLEKLELLKALTARGIFPFTAAELEAYLTEYAQAGFPMVSHSPQYRAAYKPAYRIIKADLLAGNSY